jgi:hypothetical protein
MANSTMPGDLAARRRSDNHDHRRLDRASIGDRHAVCATLRSRMVTGDTALVTPHDLDAAPTLTAGGILSG